MSVATPSKDSLDGRVFAPADRSVPTSAASRILEADRSKTVAGGGGALRKGAASGASNLAG